MVLIVDVLKGVAAIIIARWFYPWLYSVVSTTPPTAFDLQIWGPWAVCLAGLAVLLGHSRSIWLNFSGGKSAATGLGVLLAISWPVGLGAATVFGVVLAIFRIVSLSSILAALAAIVLVCGLEQPLPYWLLAIAGAIYVILRHRSNIRRSLAGTEPRLGQSGPANAILAHALWGVSRSDGRSWTRYLLLGVERTCRARPNSANEPDSDIGQFIIPR